MKTSAFIFNIIETTLRKTRRGQLKKSDISLAINVGMNNYFDKLILTYRKGMPVAPQLLPFLKDSTVGLVKGTGTLPADFVREVSFFIPNINSSSGDFVSKDELEDRKNSVLIPPTEYDPLAYVHGLDIYVRPVNVNEITLTYFKRPAELTFSFDVSGDGRDLVLNEANSDETEFRRESAPDIIKEALMFLGVPQQDEAALALSSSTKI